jgi:hypothetical protein
VYICIYPFSISLLCDLQMYEKVNCTPKVRHKTFGVQFRRKETRLFARGVAKEWQCAAKFCQ